MAIASNFLDLAALAAKRTREIPIKRGSDGYREYAEQIDALLPADVLRVFHATDSATADKFLREGVIAENKPLPTVAGSFAPGRGLNAGLYVGDSPLAVEGYGREILELRLPKSRLTVPEEAASLGYQTPGLALSNAHTGAVVPGDIPAAQIGRWGGGPYERPPVLAELARRAPQDEALSLAQRNAAKPVSEGGLGLRPDNTAMERAAAMGYTTPAYFGAAGEVPSLDVNRGTFSREGTGSWLSESGRLASTYAGRPGGNVTPALVNTSRFGEVDAGGRNWNAIEPESVIRHSNGTDSTLAEYGANDLIGTNDLARLARSQGDKGLRIFDVKDFGSYPGPMQNIPGLEVRVPETADNLTTFDPSLVRSRFAAFDPFRRGESDLLAGIAPYAAPAAAGLAGLGVLAAPGESEAGIGGVLAKTASKNSERWMGARVPNTSSGPMPAPNTRALTTEEGEDLANAVGKVALDPGPDWKGDPKMNDYTVSYVMNRKPPDMNAGEWLYRIKDTVSPETYARLAEAVWAEGLRGGPRTWTTPSPMKGAFLGGAGLAGSGAASAYAPPPEFDPERDMMRDVAVGRSALSPVRDTSAYASLMELKRRKRAADEAARTHTPRAPMTPGAEAARAMAIEAMNQATWPLLWGSRELGRPEDLRMVNGEWR